MLITFVNYIDDYWCLMNEWKLDDVIEDFGKLNDCFGNR